MNSPGSHTHCMRFNGFARWLDSFWLVGSLAFVFNRLLGGWGHSFCHVIFGFLAYFLLMASAQLPDYLNKPGQSFYITQEDSWSLEKLFLNLETVIAVHM